MVVAQVYSVVKRVNRDWMKRLGGPKTWLTIHMVLDFIGPSLVMIHAGLLSNPKFGNATWLMQGLPNFSAGFPAIIAPVAMVSEVFGRYLYRRLPLAKSRFKHWRTFHIILTAVFYALGLIHMMLNTKGFNQFFGFPED